MRESTLGLTGWSFSYLFLQPKKVLRAARRRKIGINRNIIKKKYKKKLCLLMKFLLL